MSQLELEEPQRVGQRGNATAAMIGAVGVVAAIGATFYSNNIKNNIDLQSRLNKRQDSHETMYSSLVVLNRLFAHDPSRTTSLPVIYPVPYRAACTPGKVAEVEARARNSKAMWAIDPSKRSVTITETDKKKTTIDLEEWRCDPEFPSQIASVRVGLTTANEGAAALKEEALVTVSPPPAPRCEIVMYKPVTARRDDVVTANDIWGVLGLRVAGVAVEGEIGLQGAKRIRFPFSPDVANNVFDTRPHDAGVGVTANVTRGPMVFEGVVRAVDGAMVDCGKITVNGPAFVKLTEEEKAARRADLFLPEADPELVELEEDQGERGGGAIDKALKEAEQALKKADQKEIADDALDAKSKIPKFPRIFGCFAEGSKILMADGRLKRIEFVNEGDFIWNPVLQKPVRVRRAYAGPETDYMRTITVNGQTVSVTGDHPFATPQGVVAAADLDEGRLLPTPAGTWEPVAKASWVPLKEDVMVYNLDLDAPETTEDHLMMVNGIVSGDWWMQMRLKHDGSAP